MSKRLIKLLETEILLSEGRVKLSYSLRKIADIFDELQGVCLKVELFNERDLRDYLAKTPIFPIYGLGYIFHSNWSLVQPKAEVFKHLYTVLTANSNMVNLKKILDLIPDQENCQAQIDICLYDPEAYFYGSYWYMTSDHNIAMYKVNKHLVWSKEREV